MRLLVCFSVLMMPALTVADDSPFSAGKVEVKSEEKTIAVGYRLLAPPRIEEGKKYPLVLFLHGAGERGSDNEKQLKYFPAQMAKPAWRKTFPCFLLAPQCPRGMRWVNRPWGAKKSSPMEKAASLPMQGAITVMKQLLEKHPIDRSRIYVTGLSMGGYGTWEVAARMRDTFAAAVPICGGGDESQAKKLVGLPLWAFHGDKDRAVPVSRSRTMIAAIKKAGGSPKYTEYAGGGHNVWDRVYGEKDGVVAWMFQQKLPKKRAKR